MSYDRIKSLLLLCGLGVVAPPSTHAGIGQVDGQEVKCAGKLGKSVGKLSKTYLKELARCRDADISGKTVGVCPSTGSQAKINKVVVKLQADAGKNCASTCSATNLACLDDGLCPQGVSPETCSGLDKPNDFNMRDLGFPGPLCAPDLSTTDQLGDCVGAAAVQTGSATVDAIYGSLSNASGVSGDAARCLAQLSKATQKLIGTVVKGVVKCRSASLKAEAKGDSEAVIPAGQCRTADQKLAAKIQKAADKLTAAANGKCTDAQISELDLCGNGVGGTATTGDAAICLVDAAIEAADAQTATSERAYARVSFVEAAFPPGLGGCGDGVVNQLPNSFAKLGEECDGLDDGACPGNCAPPGDVFECTCLTEIDGSTPRYRHAFRVTADSSDLDVGWTATFHDFSLN